jgi:hypothetical protein
MFSHRRSSCPEVPTGSDDGDGGSWVRRSGGNNFLEEVDGEVRGPLRPSGASYFRETPPPPASSPSHFPAYMDGAVLSLTSREACAERLCSS